jgi:hypothetical protein
MRLTFVIIFSVLFFNLQAQQPITPQTDVNGYISFQVGDVFFQVNPKHGARITSLKLKDEEFMHVTNEVADMYGSTAWLSPQNLWGWPPQPQIDTNPYTGGIFGNKVILTSAQATANNSLKFIMRKTFSADLKDSSISISYTIINKSSNARSIAAWEIQRVPSGGLSIFPLNGDITGDLAEFFMIENDVAWWDYDSLENYANKAFADGNGGWMAHIDNKRNINIKKFADAASNFPSNTEMEIEFYAAPGRTYTEIEKHTDYKSVAVNDSTTLSTKWYLRKLPANIAITEGNPAILAYIEGIVNPVANNIKLETSSGKVIVYPNPSSGEIEIRGVQTSSKISFELLNILGKTVMKQMVSPGEKIQLTSFKNGIYLYRIQSAGFLSTGKLILKD